MARNHYVLTASTEFSQTASFAEAILRKLGYEFVLNRTKDLVEFEIEKPSYFRIVIQRRTDPEVGNFLLPSIKAARGCNMDVWLSGDSFSTETDEVGSYVREFLRGLVASLPVAPWEGLKFRESGKSKKKWQELLE